MQSGTLPSNRYRRISPDSIVYNVERSDGGWKIEALVPRGTSHQDKIKVVNWFASYRSQVRHMHPMWVTRFKSTGDNYSLEIKPTSGPKDLVENGQNLKAVWTDEVVNRYRGE